MQDPLADCTGPFLWLDDVREAPKGWSRAFNFSDAVRLSIEHNFEVVSLDHDLGEGKTGYDFCLWMAANDRWPTKAVLLHSDNVVGLKNMAASVTHDGPFAPVNRAPRPMAFIRSVGS